MGSHRQARKDSAVGIQPKGDLGGKKEEGVYQRSRGSIGRHLSRDGTSLHHNRDWKGHLALKELSDGCGRFFLITYL